jgi:hypothetical protein
MTAKMLRIQLLIASMITVVVLGLRAFNVIDFPINSDWIQLGFMWEWFLKDAVQFWGDVLAGLADDAILSLGLQ